MNEKKWGKKAIKSKLTRNTKERRVTHTQRKIEKKRARESMAFAMDKKYSPNSNMCGESTSVACTERTEFVIYLYTTAKLHTMGSEKVLSLIFFRSLSVFGSLPLSMCGHLYLSISLARSLALAFSIDPSISCILFVLTQPHQKRVKDSWNINVAETLNADIFSIFLSG